MKFTRAFWTLMAAILASTWVGCGDDKGPDIQQPVPDPVETTVTDGTVLFEELGADGITLLSVWSDPVHAGEGGGFSITVSAEAPQIILATDAAGNLRGMALAIPQQGGKAGLAGLGTGSGKRLMMDAGQVGAASTLMSVLALTPGFHTSDPDEMRSRLSGISQEESFLQALSYLRREMPSRTMSEVLGDDSFLDLFTELIEGWWESGSGKGSPFRHEGSFREDYFDAYEHDYSNLERAEVRLENRAFRYLTAYRRGLDEGGSILFLEPIHQLDAEVPSAVPLSLGSIFTWTIGDPGIKLNEINMAAPEDLALVEYWAYGPGFLRNPVEMPMELSVGDQFTPWGRSLFRFVAVPFVSAIAGIGGVAKSELLQTIGRDISFFNYLFSGINTLEAMAALDQAETTRLRARALIDISTPIITMLPTAISLIPAATNLAAGKAIIAAGPWITFGLGGFSLSNVIIAVGYWSHIGTVAYSSESPPRTIGWIELTSPNGGEVWPAGSVQEITWRCLSLDLTISYSNDSGVTWTQIVRNIPPFERSYTWTLPDQPGDRYRIRLQDTQTIPLVAESEADFTISAFTVTSPVAGDRIAEESIHNLTWQTHHATAQVRLEYSTDGGSGWAPIVASVQNTGTYAWEVPGGCGPTTRIRLRDASGQLPWAYSDGDFTILCRPVPSFTISPPAGHPGEELSFDASASTDPDGDDNELQFRWDWNNDGTWDTAFSPSPHAEHSYSSVGMKTVALEVKDSDNLTRQTTRDIQITYGNTSPVACFTVTPESGNTATEFVFDASCTEDAEDPLTDLQFHWDWNGDGVYDVQRQGIWTERHEFSQPGTYSVKLRVVDTGSASNTFTVDVEVGEPDTPPAAVSDLAVVTGSVTSSSVTLTWTAPGDDGNQGTAALYDVRYSTSLQELQQWTNATQAQGEPSPSPAGSTETFTVDGLAPRTQYRFAVKTRDHTGNWSSISNIAAATTATDTPAPVFTSDVAFSPANMTITLGQSFTVTVVVQNQGTDSDNAGISISFPQLDHADDAGRVTSSSAGDDPGHGVHPAGQMISNRNCQAMTADYLLAEYGDTDWQSGETNTYTLTVTPRQTGAFEVYVRSAMGKAGEACEFVGGLPNNGSDGYVDQQGWPAKRFSLSVDPGSLPDASYIVFTYNFGPDNGRDLDTRTRIISPCLQEEPLGWCMGYEYEPYLYWGGDNTGYGLESCYLDLATIAMDHPDAEFVDVNCGAYWYGSRSDGRVSLIIRGYSGGIMSHDGSYGFVNNGGTDLGTLETSSFHIATQMSSCIEGETFTTVRYHLATGRVELLDPRGKLANASTVLKQELSKDGGRPE